MNKIRMTADRETNFVFHMLSVAGCGYDNTYGESHRSHYPEEDLAVIRENEEQLTVCGGQQDILIGETQAAVVGEVERPVTVRVPIGAAISSVVVKRRIFFFMTILPL